LRNRPADKTGALDQKSELLDAAPDAAERNLHDVASRVAKISFVGAIEQLILN